MNRLRTLLPMVALLLAVLVPLSVVAAACGGEDATPAPAAGGVTQEQLDAAVAAAQAAQEPGLSQADIDAAVAAALAAQEPGLTQADIDAAVAAARKAEEPVVVAPGQKPFFEGKTITVLVGFAPGGGYDTYARALARHFGKYIPGNPELVVTNMTGAGSMISANFLFNEAEPDGLTLAEWNSNHIIIDVLGGNPAILWEADKFVWIGAPSDGNPVCAVMGFTGITSWDEMVATPGLKFGATAEFGGSLSDMPTIMNTFGGTDWQVISGFTGTATIRLAMQQGEVDAACWSWESMGVTGRHLIDSTGDEQMIPVSVLYPIDETHPLAIAAGLEVAALPEFLGPVADPEGRRLAGIWAAGYAFQRPWTAPPGTPQERIDILRQAYELTVKDPDFLADAAKAGLYVSPVSGVDIDGHVATVLALSKADCEAMQFLVGNRGSC